MEAKNCNAEETARTIMEANSIAVCSHINPDGDTLGSAAAMYTALTRLGKSVSLFCDDKVPDQLSFLPSIHKMNKPSGNEGPFDLMLAVDVSDPKRLGGCITLISRCARTVQIDHHPTNPLFMEVNYVDGEAPAACLLVRRILKAMDVEMDQDLAVSLYTGISTDTGNFAYASTNAECFDCMSEFMKYDLPLAQLNRVLFRERAMPQVLLLGRALNSLKYYEQGRIAVMKLTRNDFRECQALAEHADTIVNFGLDTAGTKMAMLAREGTADDGTVKFSLRAKEPECVNDIAQMFGGGGHPQAAGITLNGTLDETSSLVLDAMIKKLNGKQ